MEKSANRCDVGPLAIRQLVCVKSKFKVFYDNRAADDDNNDSDGVMTIVLRTFMFQWIKILHNQ